MVTVALAGDTMLGRNVAQRLDAAWPNELFADEIAAITAAADLVVVNLECCISRRGDPWPDPAKPFFFRAPPSAVEALSFLGVDAVTLANNHALDFGAVALLDTLAHLDDAGIAHIGAGPNLDAARRPAVLDRGGVRIGLIGVADHPADFAATADQPGIAYADLRSGVPEWLTASVAGVEADIVIVTPHWGPNMTDAPVPHVRAGAPMLVEAGARLIAGHSAHVFHGVQRLGRAVVLYDLGDFVDDYAVDERLRNDLGLLWLVDVHGDGVRCVEGVPLALHYCRTDLADDRESAWIARRLHSACAALGTPVDLRNGRLTVQAR